MTAEAPEIHTNSIAWTISRDMAIAHGLIEPNEQEAAELARQHFQYVAHVADLWDRWVPALAALDAVNGRGLRAMLDLHAPQANEYGWDCGTCTDSDGDPAEWPCTVTEQLANVAGIDLPPWLPTTSLPIDAGHKAPSYAPLRPIRGLFPRPEAFVNLPITYGDHQ